MILSVILLQPSVRRALGSHVEGQLTSHECSTLSLLNVVPLERTTTVGRFDAVWDRGLDVIPAGHLAAEEVNNCSNILPGYGLRLIDVDSEVCGLNVVSKGIVNVYRELIDPNQTCIVGVIGLYCSKVTDIISPIVSHPNIGGYIQIAASTTPVHRQYDSNSTDSYLFHIVAASSVFNDATQSLMETFNWTRISLVHDSLGLFSESVANDFVHRITSNQSLSLVSQVTITNSIVDIREALDTLSSKDVRVSFWSVSYKNSAPLLCEAYHRNHSWPGYIYIIQEPTLENILKQETSCSKEEILCALEGVFLLQYRLYTEQDTTLISGWSFSEYKERYVHELQELARRTSRELNETDYANVLYDQVWAFALAINKSIPLIHSQNLSLRDYNVHRRNMPPSSNMPSISDILKDELRSISFQGATGRVHFGENQENVASIDIFQVINGTPELIGVYDQFPQSITFTGNAPQNRNIAIPNDTFETDYELLPLWLAGCIIVTQGILFCMTTANLIFIIMWRKKREIKATSPILSMLMMAGCYILCMGPILLAVLFTTYSAVVENSRLLTFLCVSKGFATIGLEFIFATLLFRLLRIQHIFRSKRMAPMSNHWLDRYLLVYVLFVCAGKVVLVILWNSVDPIHPVIYRKYISESSKLPHYVANLECMSNSSSVWLVIMSMYSGLLLLLVLILAVMTRHIKYSMYKDTKKVNLFIFLVVLVLAIVLPLREFFHDLRSQIGVVVSEWLAYFSVQLLCQVCLFIPKTLPLVTTLVLKRSHFSSVRTSSPHGHPLALASPNSM